MLLLHHYFFLPNLLDYKTIKKYYLLEYILDTLPYVLFIGNNLIIILSIDLVLIIEKLRFYNLSGLNALAGLGVPENKLSQAEPS